MFSPEQLDLTRTTTCSAQSRRNLTTIDSILEPGKRDDLQEFYSNPDLNLLVDAIIQAKADSRMVIAFYGAHAIKRGLSRYLIKLMELGFISHLASNGAGSIHDFELALLGGTSEHVPTAIQDGSFGMWEETGGLMNEAINFGAKKGWGYGESLANFVDSNQSLFKHKDICVFYQAHKMGMPLTYHVTIGTDIIHQHPGADFGAIGAASGVDFKVFCKSVSKLDQGVFLNFGSAVTGPEVFLKAISISRNQGYATTNITTANFDLLQISDWDKITDKSPAYYYRPLKNVVLRPAPKGKGYFINGDHADTIPALYNMLVQREL
ncbi:MAG: hypothetical protein LBC41_13100 [Clostridiales bacterium]|nr:hypothetical protein [Clostridiales bacterium]